MFGMLALFNAQGYMPPMAIGYREDKATQAAARLLQLGGGSLNLMKLVKLLYFAERRAVIEWGRPITFDELWSLKHGPILGATLENINSEPFPGSETYWQKYISPRSANHRVSFVGTVVPNDQLSRAEERVLTEVFQEFGHLDQWQLRDYAHEHFPEWKDPGNSRFPIAIRDILLAEGYSESDVSDIEHDLRGEAVAERLDHE